MRVSARAKQNLRCAYCHGELTGSVEPCAGCGTRVHADCGEGRRCPTLGCRLTVSLREPMPAARSSRAWLLTTIAVLGLMLGVPVLAAMQFKRAMANFERGATPIRADITSPIGPRPGDERITRGTADVLVTACRDLLDVPYNHGRLIERHEADLPLALRAAGARYARVHDRAVVVSFTAGEGVVVMREGFDLEREHLPEDAAVTPLAPGLWRYRF